MLFCCVAVAILPAPLVLPLVGDTSLLPQGTAKGGLVGLLGPQLPPLQALDKTLLKDRKREGGRGHPWVTQSISAGPHRGRGRRRPSACLSIGALHQAAPALAWGQAEAATVMRRAGAAVHGRRGAVAKAGRIAMSSAPPSAGRRLSSPKLWESRGEAVPVPSPPKPSFSSHGMAWKCLTLQP